MLKVKLIRSEKPCSEHIVRAMMAITVLLASIMNDFCVFQLPADETKLKMMQEVSENFEVSLINVIKQPLELILKRFSKLMPKNFCADHLIYF